MIREIGENRCFCWLVRANLPMVTIVRACERIQPSRNPTCRLQFAPFSSHGSAAYRMFRIDLLKPFQHLWQMIASDTSPRQLAFGVAIGLMVGLIPKGNLVAVAMVTLLFALRVNVGVGLLTALLVSFAAGGIDPLTDRLGAFVLAYPPMYEKLAQAFQYPVVPWTSLNNTVVLGGLLLGAVLFYPVFHLAETGFRWLGPLKLSRVREALRKRDVAENPLAAAERHP